MPTATVTPGYVFANNELVTYTKLNALGNPTVAVTIGSTISPQNYLRNGNFYGPFWNQPAGLTCTTGTETFNAQNWSVNPTGASVTYLQNSTVPNTHSLYSAQIVGATSVTTVNFSQTISGDLSDTLNTTVSFSVEIFNNSGINLVPVLIISSANSLNNFTAVTQIASTSLQTITNNTWGYETATVNLTGLSNVNNGLKITIQFPSGALSSGTQSVNVSQAMLVTGSTPITFVDDFPLFVASALGYQPLFTPYNNLALNGAFDVWQEKTSYAGLTGAATTPTADGWKVGTTGTLSVTFAQDTSANISPTNIYGSFLTNAGKFTVQTAEASLSAGDFLYLQNSIEGYQVENLQGRNFSIQFWVKSTTTGVYYVSLTNNANGASYNIPYTIATANTWQFVTLQNITLFNTGIGTWNFNTGLGLGIRFTLGCGSTFQSATINSWISGNFLGTASQTNLVASLSNTWEVTGLQIEPGSIVTPFNYIPFADTLFKAKRYYQKSYDYSTAPGTATTVGATYFVCTAASVAQGGTKLCPAMRVDPVTLVAYNVASGTANSSTVDLNTSSGVGSASTIAASAEQIQAVGFTSGGTAGHVMESHWSADSRL